MTSKLATTITTTYIGLDNHYGDSCDGNDGGDGDKDDESDNDGYNNNNSDIHSLANDLRRLMNTVSLAS